MTPEESGSNARNKVEDPMKMTPEEKWKRLINPKTAEDYRLSLTDAELETFAEGRELLAGLQQLAETLDDQGRLMTELGKAAGEHVEQVLCGALTSSAAPPCAKQQT